MFSVSWDRYMPTILIFYDNGKIDLHCQTGDHHYRSIKKAKYILEERGLKIKDGDNGMIAPSGAYYNIEEISK